jgi:aspartyl/asparaginyl beta-hydroxylase (cupin superfamily)
VIRHVMRATVTANMQGDPIGLLNRVFERVYTIRLEAKRINARSRRTYYVLSYAAKLAPIAALVWLGLRAAMR